MLQYARRLQKLLYKKEKNNKIRSDTKTTADANGWARKKGNLGDIFPGKSIGGDVYDNRNHKLPEKQGRIWYEADFDYYGGYRNDSRILYSSDGLIFVTYDHYKTFYEVC